MIYMEEVFNNILVFKTNIKTEADRQAVKALLDGHSCIRKWNVDLQDVDCVLRIVLRPFEPSALRQAQGDRYLTVQDTINLITQHGYECSELL